uniref:Superoxide dismutase n=1 Tax=Franklinothrips vespiformis TaxID=297892 RepID=A0A481SWR8_FRAVS|nr:manganese-iron superoxide dismutase [Franklinothrips vespiformis]
MLSLRNSVLTCARRSMKLGMITSLSANKHTLPELPYEYNALEPVISRDIMTLHHQKHHAAYVTNYNAALERLQAAISKNDISGQLNVQKDLIFNGGGHINHSIFWQNLTPDTTEPDAKLCAAINARFGSFENFKTALVATAVGVQGSGWAWLVYNKNNKSLDVTSTANQTPILPADGLTPLLGIDVWEHAYYLQYKNVRADYAKAIFDVINWKDVSERLSKATA